MAAHLKFSACLLSILMLALLGGARVPAAAWAGNDTGANGAILALTEMQAAIDKGDGTRFEELVDIDAILNNGLDIFLNKAGNMGLPPVAALMLSGIGSQAALRKLLVDETRAFVLNNINNGSFAGKAISGASSQGHFAPLFSGASTGRKEVLTVEKPRPESGGWVVPFTVLDHGNSNYYRIEGWFTEENGQTRLKAVRNLNELFNIISQEASR